MTVVPKFAIPTGSKVKLLNTEMVVAGMCEDGYKFTVLDTGASMVVPFQSFVDYLKLPGVKIDTALPVTGNRLQIRLGGIRTSKSLKEKQQDRAKFNLALCRAMELLRSDLRDKFGNQNLALSTRGLNRTDHREFIHRIAQTLFGETIHLDPPRSEKRDPWVMYRGVTLIRHLAAFDAIQLEENPLDALVRLDHLKGNRAPRITDHVKQLMTKAWEDIGLDLKGPAVSNVFHHLETLIHNENKRRKCNDLPPLLVPSASTLAAHRDYLLTPTEYLVATKGERFARNKSGRGSTDIRALLVGEYVEIDECLASLVASAKITGVWESMSPEFRGKLEEIDKVIQDRLTILVMIDVATRMPLAWVISDRPKAEATLALFRMATRDKTLEKLRYGCEGEPVAAIGIGNIKNDNGPGLRNSTCISALMGVGAWNTIVRTYNSTDKPYVERMFGTDESTLFKVLHGYTGRRPGDLPGYDATRNGVLDIDELYGILTRFMIDVYPSMQHMGVGMGGRRPADVYEQIAVKRGCIPQIDPDTRRIHLGWEQKVTPTDEGVRVFSGIWFNSDELQAAIEDPGFHRQKVSVFVDPDQMDRATVLIPGAPEPIEVYLQTTAFASLTLVEILDLMAAWRKENPKTADIHDDRIMRFRSDVHQMMQAIGVERKLPRSYSTLAECQAKAKAVFAGSRILPSRALSGTTAPENIMRIGGTENIFKIGSEGSLIEGTLVEPDRFDDGFGAVSPDSLAFMPGTVSLSSEPVPASPPSRRTRAKPTPRPEAPEPAFGRPKTVKELE